MYNWENENKEIISFLDTIDLKSEMINREELSSFMDRLEEKYPYQNGLFNDFGADDFEEYLWKRYGRSYVQEEIRRYIWAN